MTCDAMQRCRSDIVIGGITSNASMESRVASCDVMWDSSDQGLYKVDCAVPPVNLAGNWSLSASVDGGTISPTQIRMTCPMLEYETPFSNPIGECVECMEGVICDSPGAVLSTLRLKPGFWRSSTASEHIHKCSYGFRACIGGTGGNGTCHDGYTGPMCSSCARGYFSNANTDKCEDCNSASSSKNIDVLLICVFLALVIVGYVGVKILIGFGALLLETMPTERAQLCYFR